MLRGLINSTENGDCAIFFADIFPDLIQHIEEWGYSECYRMAYKKIHHLHKDPNSTDQIEFLLDNGWEEDSIQYYIKKDDISNLQKKVYTTNDFNKPLEWSEFEWYPKPTQCTMISYAALFGAKQCFEWFLSKNIKITDSVCDAALIGCNYSIITDISLREKNFITDKNRLPVLHKYFLFEYLAQNKWTLTLSYLASIRCRNYQSIVNACNNGETIDSRDHNQENGLHHMAKAGLLEFVDLFLNYSYDARSQNSMHQTIMILAAESGNTRLVQYLVSKKQFPINDKWGLEYKDTIIHAAALSGSVKMIKLLRDDFNINIHLTDDTNSIIYFAAMSGSVSLVKYLIKYEKYPITYVSNYNTSLLYIAVSKNFVALIKYLIKHEINPASDPFYNEMREKALNSNILDVLLSSQDKK